MPGFFERHSNVYLYLPNLVGYARVACALYAFYQAPRSPIGCVLAYVVGFVCDETDGRLARSFNQTSTLGTVLDMVTDRLSTAGLLVILSMLYPTWHMLFIGLLMLDIFSHWFQMYSTLVAGISSHKDVTSRSWVVRTYYRYRLFMGFCCVCCEVLYLMLYLLHWEQYQQHYLVPLMLPQQVLAALNGLVHVEGLPLPLLLAAISLPGTAIKQFINLVQLRTAMQNLVQYDVQRMAAETSDKRK